MTAPSGDEDGLLTVAFSLHANPGAYALLLGAGVSAPSGIPTAWGVLEDLVGLLAEVAGESPEDAIEWYESKFADAPTYEGVLERIAPTQIERQRILRSYFEQSPEDIEANRKVPTEAHRSIARLVRAGAVKVIMTLNFDRLIERALKDEGIEPTVVASPADIQGMAPLHTLDCCIVHLHGDYLNPTSMLNTVSELKEYNPSTAKLLQTVLENYGLILAGWSSVYDPALRAAIAARYPSRFTLTWFEPGRVSEQANDLRMLKKGLLVSSDADTGFGRLADGVEALATRRSRHPLTIPVAVETAKRELSGRTVSIGLHDTIKREFTTLHQIPEFHLSNYHGDHDYEGMLARVEEATRLTGALVATLAYWGNTKTDSWWLNELARFATPANAGGLVKLLSLRMVSGGILFYASGVAAVAAQRFDLLKRMFSLRRVDRYRGEQESIARVLDGGAGYEGISNPSSRVFEIVSPLLSEALSIGFEPLDDAWQVFEVLRLAWITVQDPRFGDLRSEHAEMDEAYQDAKEAYEGMEGGADGDLELAQRNSTTAWQNRDRVLGKIARLAPAGSPHVLTVDRRTDERYQSDVALHLLNDLSSEGAAHPLVMSGFVDDVENFALALNAVNARLGILGRELSWERVRNSAGFIPSEMWLDSAKTPAELAAERNP